MTITADLLIHAYASGIFPMAETRESDDLFWVDPRRRGILPLDGFHISRSLARRMRKGGYRVAINEDFEGVVSACADRAETWINPTLRVLYGELHARGIAHSFEIRDAGPPETAPESASSGSALWGGVFGIALGGAFFGESMMSRRTDGSKIALAHLVDHLRRAGFTLFDTQFLTDHLASLGGIEISRAEYRRRLAEALEHHGRFAQIPVEQDPYSVIQRNTQTS